MKKVSVYISDNKETHKNGKGYSFSVGYRTYLHFDIKKDAVKYSRKYCRMVGVTAHSLSDINVRLYGLYRMHYYQFNDLDSHNYNIKFTTFIERFDYIYINERENPIQFTALQVCYDILQETLLEFKVWSNKNKAVAFYHELIAIDKLMSFTWRMYKQEQKDIFKEVDYLKEPIVKLKANFLKLKKA